MISVFAVWVLFGWLLAETAAGVHALLLAAGVMRAGAALKVLSYVVAMAVLWAAAVAFLALA